MVWHRHTSLKHFTYPPKWMLVADSDPRVRQHSSYTIHPSINSRRPCVSCGRCTCLEFLATQCSVHVVAGILLSTSKDSPVRYVTSSLTLNAVLELNFVQCPCNSSVIASLKSYSFIHGDQQRQKQVRRLKPEINECAVEQVCTM